VTLTETITRNGLKRRNRDQRTGTDFRARESLIFARLQAWDKAITSGPESLINHIERKP
jgi:hypothetical protein